MSRKVLKLMDSEVLKTILAMKRDDGQSGSQISNNNLRYPFVLIVLLSLVILLFQT
jgi:hypothetical protein